MLRLSRRALLRALAASGVVCALPGTGLATPRRGILVLVELVGGNDGLGTVVPRKDPLYRRFRPTLALSAAELLPLDEARALPRALAPLAPLFQAGKLAVVEGVGTRHKTRSHFLSADLWRSGSGMNRPLSEGWAARVLAGRNARVLLAGERAGPFSGAGTTTLQPTLRLPPSTATRAPTSEALAHIAAVRAEAAAGERELARLGALAPLVRPRLEAQVELVEKALAAELSIDAYHLALGGFDTHARQRPRHALLLEQLGEALARLFAAAARVGRADDVVIATCSEFGRRPRENASGGTDHGRAAPLFVVGGRVRGGFYGAPPSLEVLDEQGDLVPSVDARAVFGGIARLAFGIDAQLAAAALGGVAPLDLGRGV